MQTDPAAGPGGNRDEAPVPERGSAPGNDVASPRPSAPAVLPVFCPAKINLHLEIVGRRLDGYHEVRTVMQAIDLRDELRLDEAGGGIDLRCDPPTVPADPGNLCWKAAEAMRRRAGGDRGVRILLMKSVPVAAGLGGGSSDAAGVLRGLNILWGKGLSNAALEDIGAGIGSDVPFFIGAGTALCTGRGEMVRRIEGAPSLPYVLVTPPVRVSTADVYASLDSSPGFAPVGEDDLLRAIAAGDPGRIGECLFNRLETAGGAHMPLVAEIKSLLLDAGGVGASMSGSGPSVFCLAPGAGEARTIAERVARRLGEGHFVHWGMTNSGV
ncbi:MAG: 4-(cytidine 5'-diphospho)-2-C-methyl-D-erythritol kinase [bacterium]|nr:4-(cytidine 5'-diphospho)-2-C-methyl-D-erythritol kinase [bacterium]